MKRFSVRNKLRKCEQMVKFMLLNFFDTIYLQFDALLGQLTGKETLRMYSRLRGIPEENLDEMIQSLLSIVGLSEFGDRACQETLRNT